MIEPQRTQRAQRIDWDEVRILKNSSQGSLRLCGWKRLCFKLSTKNDNGGLENA